MEWNISMTNEAYLLARVVLGALFFFQAFDKIFRITLSSVCDEVCRGTSQKGIPIWFARVSVFISSYLELVGGFLLMIGLFTHIWFLAFAVHLILLHIAFGYLQGVWDTRHTLPRLLLLLILMVMPESWNTWSFDALLWRP